MSIKPGSAELLHVYIDVEPVGFNRGFYTVDVRYFYPTQSSQCAIDRAVSIKPGSAELLHVYIDVEPVGFNRGFYTVDVRYFYRVTADAFVGAARPVEISGLCVFDKRVILFGSEGGAKTFSSVDVRYFYRVTADAFVGAARPVEISGLCVFDKRVILFGSEGGAKTFSSQVCCGGLDEQELRKSGLPSAVVEAVDPIVLSMKLVDVCECRCCDCELTEIPPCVCSCFGSDLNFGSEGKRVYVTLGQFSIIRLERDTQLLMPVYDYCMPEKECACGSCGEEDPCELFRQVKFPQFSIIRLERDTQLLMPVYDYCMPEKECACGSCGEEDPCELFRQVKFPVNEFFPPNTMGCGESCKPDLPGCCRK